MHKRNHGISHTVREYVTHWTVAGACLAATGAAPEHWVAEIMQHVPWLHEGVPAWLTTIDYRLVAVIVGLSIIVGDTLWRHHGLSAAAVPAAGGRPSQEAVPAHESLQTVSDIADPDKQFIVKSLPRNELLLPDRPSVAVLPFTNMSGDAEQEYFADGVAEDVITALSRMGWLFVTARNSSFSYKGKSPDIRVVGQDLGVRYVLEGSIRKAGGRVRIACQLIEAATGGHVWADRFEGDLQDIFDLQDRISESVAGAIEPNLQRAEIARATAAPTESLDAYDLYLRALAHFHAFNRDGVKMASNLLHQALALDNTYPRAKAFLGWVHVLQVTNGWVEPNEAGNAVKLVADNAIKLAEDVIKSDWDDPSTLRTAALVLSYFVPTSGAARAAADRALSLSPTSAPVLFSAGWVYNSAGDAVAAIDFFQRAQRLSPLDPAMPVILAGLGMAYLQAGRDEDARQTFLRSIHELLAASTLRGLITALIRQGQTEEARAAAGQMLAFWPEFRVSTVWIPFHDNAFVQEQRNACRLAGLPE